MRATVERALRRGPEAAPDGALEFEFVFPEGEPVFAGHFPDYPILPGVFQIEMARQAAELATGRRLALAEVEKAKFSRPIRPGDEVRLELRLEEAGETLRAKARLIVNGERVGESSLTLRTAP